MKRLLLVAALMVAGVVYYLVDPGAFDTPDADQQEASATKCLKAAGFKVKSDIPSYSRISKSPEFVLEVSDEGGEEVAFVYLFDFPDDAETFIDEDQLDADYEDKKTTLKQIGPAAIDLDTSHPGAGKVRDCVEKAGKPPEKET